MLNTRKLKKIEEERAYIMKRGTYTTEAYTTLGETLRFTYATKREAVKKAQDLEYYGLMDIQGNLVEVVDTCIIYNSKKLNISRICVA